jgi:hypothetical protein
MTLMEVVVALVIAGTALAAGATALGFLADQQTRPGIQSIAAASAVRTTMRSWTSHARLTTEGDAQFRGAPAMDALSAFPTAHDSADGDLTFVTTASTDVAAAGTQVHLHIQRDRIGAPGLVAQLTPFRAPGATTTMVLAPHATGFQARYLGSLFGRMTWQKSWVSTSVLPVAVEIRIHFDSGANDPADVAARALLAMPMTIPVTARR